ncbi:MAG: metalloregulator ArsR/SmtB family transcription factor [Actinobacteria bacterium]|nr:metalloregulator ArsR/SmtB family transcription factor [Actinomycetota bacterium]
MESIELDIEIAKLGHAFANPLRVRILELLTQREKSVDEIRKALSSPVTSVSSQLKILRQARLVDTRREGQRIYYRLAEEAVVSTLISLRNLAEARSLEAQSLVRDFLAETNDLELIDSDRLFSRMRADEVILIDVRPSAEFEAGHIPGAISLPLEELTDRIDQLPRGARVVAYCRDAYCVLAPSAVRALKRFGLATERLDIGFAEWMAEGGPVEHTAEHTTNATEGKAS